MSVSIERQGTVATVVFDRPGARNAIDPETATALRTAFEDVEADGTTRCAVLWGAGDHFCAGFDLKALAVADIPSLYDAAGDGPMGPTRQQLAIPVIAAVEGYAVAGGLELALWCDLRVAGQMSVFGVFNRRFGVPLVDGGTVRLPRLIGAGRASDLILTGRPVDADEALAIGLINRLVPAGRARSEAEALAARIANLPQASLLADRASAERQWSLSLEDALRAEAEAGLAPLLAESTEGAGRFAAGSGRGGTVDDT
jgi:enoyl-CoA hydratase